MKPVPPADPSRTLELERFLPYRLSVLANTMSTAVAGAYAARFQLSIPEWRVVAVLARSPDLSAAQVAQRTAMDKVAVSRAVSSLVRSGRVARSVEESDRRRSRLRLTVEGASVYQQVVPWALAYEDAVLRGIPARMQAVLHDLLDELSVSAAAVAARHPGAVAPGADDPSAPPSHTLRSPGE